MHVINHPPVPFWSHLEEGVAPGLVIYIAGHIPYQSERFDINLVKGHETGYEAGKNNSIALHVNPRVHEDYVVLNSRKKKSWVGRNGTLTPICFIGDTPLALRYTWRPSRTGYR